MCVGVARTAHSQSNDANNYDENCNERYDSANNSDDQSVVIAHRLLNLWQFRLNLGRLRDWNAPNDFWLLSRRAGENS